MKFDDGASDNTSKYDTTYNTGQSFIHDNDSYKLQRTENGFGSILVKDLIVENNVEIICDFKIDNTSPSLNNQPRLCLFNSNNDGVGARLGIYGGTKYTILGTVTPTTDVSPLVRDDYSSLTTNIWYTIVLSNYNGTLTYKLYDGETLVKTLTTTTSLFNNQNKVGIQEAYTNGTIMHFKNLKIKPL